MKFSKVRTIFGEVVFLIHHARKFYLSFIFSPTIGALGLSALMFGRIFIFPVISVLLLPSILLILLSCIGMHRVYL